MQFKYILILLTFITTLEGSAQTIEKLGDFIPFDISADGSVLVGERRDESFNKLAVMWKNGSLDDLWPNGTARTVSGDGLVVTGIKNFIGYQWTNGAGQEFSPPWGQYEDRPIFTNSDGSIIVGYVFIPNNGGTVGFLWKNGTFTKRSIDKYTSISCASEDGSVYGGSTGPFFNSSSKAVLWANGGQTIFSTEESGIAEVSSSGDRVLANDPGGAYLYEVATGSKVLIGGIGMDMTGDGSLVVGINPDSSFDAFLWTPGAGRKPLTQALSEDYGIDTTGLDIHGIHTMISDDGSVLAGRARPDTPGGAGTAWRVSLTPREFEIQVIPEQPNYGINETLELEITVRHSGDDPVTYSFEDGLFTQDPLPVDDETPVVSFGEFETPEPFTLSKEDPKKIFILPATTEKPGVLLVSSSVNAQPSGGTSYTLEAEQAIIVAPLKTEVTITNKRHHWNSTAESDWGDRAKAINAQRRIDGEEPYLNLIEIELGVTNESDDVIDNLNIPTVRDITGYIQSTTEDPSVPLLPIRLYAPDGAEVDLTNLADTTEVNDLTLPSGETATFAWVVEAFEIDVEVREDPFDLEFTPLIRASQSGEELQHSARETFSIRLRGPIVVNVTSDERDFDPADGVIDVDPDEEGEQISLRAAIEYANDTPGLDRIEFDIPGDGVPEIKVGPPPLSTNIMALVTDGDLFPTSPSSDTPYYGPSSFAIISALKTTDPVEIDGTSQAAGWVLLTGQDLINLVALSDLEAYNGLEIAGGDSQVSGMVINRFPGVGLVLTEKGDNVVAGNRIGMDTTGMIAFGNGSILQINQKGNVDAYPPLTLVPLENVELSGDFDDSKFAPVNRIYAGGILVNSPNNTIGGNREEDRNLFSGHGRILNRFEINPFNVVWVSLFVSDVIISGSNAANNKFIGNYVGTDVKGERSNEGYSLRGDVNEVVSGILINNGASNNTIRNNLTPAVVVEDAQKTLILENQIGLPTEPKGSIDRGGLGITFSTDTLVQDNRVAGSVALNESTNTQLINNVIEDEKSLDIYKSDNATIKGNRIGMDADGNHNEGTHYNTVSIYGSTGITLGGPNLGEGNTIAATGYDGYDKHGAIEIWDRDLDATEGTRLVHVGNNFVAHSTLGPSKEAYVVDLDNDGTDVIDFGDLDGKQNYPRLAFVTPENGNLRFEGNLDSHLGGDTYYLDFYKTDSPLPSGHGGTSMTYIGRGTVETDTVGYGQFDLFIPFTDFEDSDYFTVTATRADGGETSEYSRNRRLNDSYLNDLNREAYGDRNGDGTDDVDQDNVASFSAPNGADTTIQVSAATSQTSDPLLPTAHSDFGTRDDANPTLENVLPETQASMGAPKNYTYSNGVITFAVPDLSAGASVSVKLILADDATPDTLWVLQADDTWTNSIPFSIDGNQVTLMLTDGGAGDRDGEANGRIVAAIGPATALPPLPEMKLTVTRQSSAHTLSWPSPYSNAVLEFSPDLSPDSWDILDFPLSFGSDQWHLTLPNPSNPLPEFNDSGFYRLRYENP